MLQNRKNDGGVDDGWREDQERIRREDSAPLAPVVRSNPDQSVLLVHGRYEAFEGAVRNGPYLRIAGLLDRPANIRHRGDVRLDGRWRPGELAVTLPHMTVESRTPAVSVLGLAIDLDRFSGAPAPGGLNHAAEKLIDDPLLSSVMTALWHESGLHGGGSAFFDHGVALILDRLAVRRSPAPTPSQVRPLGAARLARVQELIEGRLDGDLGVVEMAAAVGYDPSGFTRAFRAATGQTPFVYLTARRMARARRLLAKGHAVTQVAAEVGYANPSKFAAAFARATGCSPSHFRRETSAASSPF